MSKDHHNTRPPSDEYWMKLALEKAEEAGEKGEVPVGAVVVFEDKLIGRGGNGPIGCCDPTAHAEILALREASISLGNYRLPNATLYVTLEPCIMCMGAIVHARIQKLVYGADDPKTGAAHSVYQIGCDGLLNHQVEISGGMLAKECSQLLKNFFKGRRSSKNSISLK